MENRSIVDVVDNALDHRRSCSSCGAPTMVRTEGNRLFIVCSSGVKPRRDLLGRLLAILVPHDRVAILT